MMNCMKMMVNKVKRMKMNLLKTMKNNKMKRKNRKRATEMQRWNSLLMRNTK
jgi:hypothetical protein